MDSESHANMLKALWIYPSAKKPPSPQTHYFFRNLTRAQDLTCSVSGNTWTYVSVFSCTHIRSEIISRSFPVLSVKCCYCFVYCHNHLQSWHLCVISSTKIIRRHRVLWRTTRSPRRHKWRKALLLLALICWEALIKKQVTNRHTSSNASTCISISMTPAIGAGNCQVLWAWTLILGWWYTKSIAYSINSKLGKHT